MAAIASLISILFRSACGVPSIKGISVSTMVTAGPFFDLDLEDEDFGFGGGFAGDEGRKDTELEARAESGYACAR